MMKTCSKCKIEKDKQEFYPVKNTKDGLHSWCKSCEKSYVSKWRKENPTKRNKYNKKVRDNNIEKYREVERKRWKKDRDNGINRNLKSKYGITLEQKNQMITDQNGLCKSCKEPLGVNPSKIHVDHDHTTGEVRGILCRDCNVSFGSMKENPTKILGLFHYSVWCKNRLTKVEPRTS